MNHQELAGELHGCQVKLPRNDVPQTTPKVTLSSVERQAIEEMELPSWARRLGLVLVPSDKESIFTAKVRALAYGIFNAEPPRRPPSPGARTPS